MAYTDRNFKTKKAFKEAVEQFNNGTGPKVTAYQPGPFGGSVNPNGQITIEGPHYPKPHTWYAQCETRDGAIVKVK